MCLKIIGLCLKVFENYWLFLVKVGHILVQNSNRNSDSDSDSDLDSLGLKTSEKKYFGKKIIWQYYRSFLSLCVFHVCIFSIKSIEIIIDKINRQNTVNYRLLFQICEMIPTRDSYIEHFEGYSTIRHFFDQKMTPFSCLSLSQLLTRQKDR